VAAGGDGVTAVHVDGGLHAVLSGAVLAGAVSLVGKSAHTVWSFRPMLVLENKRCRYAYMYNRPTSIKAACFELIFTTVLCACRAFLFRFCNAISICNLSVQRSINTNRRVPSQKLLECGPMPNEMAALQNIEEYRWRPLFNAAKFG